MHWEQLMRLNKGKMERLEGGVYPALGECPEDVMSEAQRTRQAVAQLQQKILKLTEQLRIEQVARDDNVSEYLDLSAHAVDKQQSARIKQVFEKKNQKSAASISQLQRKLDHYHRRLREADHCGLPRQPKDVLRDMQQGLRGVGARLSEGVVDSVTHLATKPREIACLFRHRFGSADNISTLKEGAEGGEDGRHLQSSPKFGSEEDCSSATSGSNSVTGGPGGSPGSRGGWDVLVQEVQELREAQAQLEQTLESLKNSHLRECAVAMQTLQEERFRCERLEEQLNDLTELHQNEILNLKQELLSVEEKINYQSNERARDLQEALEACQTRVSKMELQQQVVQLECLENAAARTLLGKLISVLLALMAVLLVFVTGVANCVIPMMKTRSRSVSTLLLALLLAVLWKNWERFSGHTYRILRVS